MRRRSSLSCAPRWPASRRHEEGLGDGQQQLPRFPDLERAPLETHEEQGERERETASWGPRTAWSPGLASDSM